MWTPRQTSRYYAPPFAGGLSLIASSSAIASGRITAIPFNGVDALSIDRVGIMNRTLTTTGTFKCRFGVYADAGGYPGALIAETAGTVSPFTGVKQIEPGTVSAALPPGKTYWLAMLSEGGTMQTYARYATTTTNRDSPNSPYGFANSFTGGPGLPCILSTGVATGAMPNPFPIDATTINGADIALWFRCSSITPAIGGSLVWSLLTQGNYHTSPDFADNLSAKSGGTNIVSGHQWCSPFLLPSAKTVTNLALDISTNASFNFRVGIYNDSSGYPGALLVDGGLISNTSPTAVNGIKPSGVISQTLAAQTVYWLSVLMETTQGATTINLYSNSGLHEVPFGRLATDQTLAALGAFKATGVATGSMPADFTPSLEPVAIDGSAGGIAPAVYVLW